MILLLLLSTLAALSLAACGEGTVPTPDASTISKLPVVTTTVILADLVRNVGGDRVEVRSIVPPGADIHTFQATPGDSIAVNLAVVIVSNGSGLDDFLEPFLRSAKRSDAVHVVASEGLGTMAVKALAFPGQTIDGLRGIEQVEAVIDRGDPHFWQNPLYAIYYVGRIRDGLMEADPGSSQAYQANASAYIEKLRTLDQEIATILSAVPPVRRHLVTFHDAFGYFAAQYGWTVSAFVRGDASDVTPARMAEVMERIEERGITAVFAEPQFNPDVMNRTARDAGVAVGLLYSDALDTTAQTYIDMMRFNANSLARHLR